MLTPHPRNTYIIQHAWQLWNIFLSILKLNVCLEKIPNWSRHVNWLINFDWIIFNIYSVKNLGSLGVLNNFFIWGVFYSSEHVNTSITRQVIFSLAIGWNNFYVF